MIFIQEIFRYILNALKSLGLKGRTLQLETAVRCVRAACSAYEDHKWKKLAEMTKVQDRIRPSL